MTINRFEDLIAWQKARQLVAAVYGVTTKGALAKDCGLRAAIRSKDAETLLALQATNKRLQQENIQLNADVARLASIVQTLNDEIARLRAVGTGRVVELVRQ